MLAPCLGFTVCLCLALQRDVRSNFAMQFGMSISAPQKVPLGHMAIATARSLAHTSDSQFPLESPEDALSYIIKWPRKISNKKYTATPVTRETSDNSASPTTADTYRSSNAKMLMSAAPLTDVQSRLVPSFPREITPINIAQDTGDLSDSASWVSTLHVHIM